MKIVVIAVDEPNIGRYRFGFPDTPPADASLRDGRVRLKDCKSSKGKTYNATVLLSTEADGRSKFSLEFEGGR